MSPQTPLPPLRIAAAQLPGAPGERGQRLAIADRAVALAAGASLVVLPEAYLPGYCPTQSDPTAAIAAQAWAQEAAARSGAHIAVGAATRVAGNGASELILAAPDGRVWRYRKRYPTFAEAAHWQAGDAPGIAETAIGRIGMALCADVVQPGLWRALAGRVDLVIVSAAWTDYGGRKGRLGPLRRMSMAPWMEEAGAHRDATLSAAAEALGVPIVYANATGPFLDQERFSGGSRVMGQKGQQIDHFTRHPELGDADAGLAVADLSPGAPGPGRCPDFAPRWRLFSLVHRWAARARAQLPSTR